MTEIYPFANVDRGTLGKVRIGRGTKIDHYVHVGHNCTVGQNTIVTAGVVMCGGSHIGDNVWIGVSYNNQRKVYCRTTFDWVEFFGNKKCT